jgi:hypothetical protein
MSVEARANLGQKQAALMAALVGAAPAPAGFESTRLQTAARSLASKRRRSVARAWPNLVAALGDRYFQLFDDFAAQTPLPRHGGPLADGYAFAHRLRVQGELPEAGRLEIMGVELRCRVRKDGLMVRRWGSMQFAFLRHPLRLVVAFRWPRWGERWGTIRIGR